MNLQRAFLFKTSKILLFYGFCFQMDVNIMSSIVLPLEVHKLYLYAIKN
ncbi:hypothetical protein KL86DYS2_11342 [uncultured Dysgonomonas sp.]|uniref:Uncharacterized protein n=1 Tax=uncultured Dysgonomonas sp. TaxID=206096 RepID=A0A212JEF1_9BACT|nr:hypothetical protein KL86DYS2_11342 [uncultured Dysgonomonas sp.]